LRPEILLVGLDALLVELRGLETPLLVVSTLFIEELVTTDKCSELDECHLA
jgi:hypothetical protein